MDWLALLTAFGVGSVVSALIQSLLVLRSQNSARSFAERKEAYIGLLEAWVRQENEGISYEAKLDVGHWVLRCELVGSKTVFVELQNWKDCAPGSDRRIASTKSLKAAMRADLS